MEIEVEKKKQKILDSLSSCYGKISVYEMINGVGDQEMLEG